MNTFCDSLCSAYPEYVIKQPSNECVVKDFIEPANNKDFLSLKITGNNLRLFHLEFPSATTSFYNKAKSIEPLTSNCDGIIFAQKDERNILLFCELKSSFIDETIIHAKEQIVGTLLRTLAQFSIIQNKCKFEIHGLIVSYTPTLEKLNEICKLTGPKGFFLQNLCTVEHHDLKAEKCASYYSPWDVPGFRIHYLGVPKGQQHYTTSIDNVLSK